MSEHFISRAEAEGDLLACAAYVGERIKSGDGRAEAMNSVVPRYLAKGSVDLAAELANAVDDPFSRDKLLTLVAEKCAEIDDDEYALQLADSVDDQGLQSQAFERIALVKAAMGHLDKAREIGDTMAHSDFVFGAIAVKQAADGDVAAALETLGAIDFATARVSALQQIAVSNIENDPIPAIDLLERAVAAADEIEHDEEKIRVLCEIGNLFIEAKRNDKAIETFDTARGFAEILDNTHRDFFLAACALGFLHAGSNDVADRTLDLITDKTQMASALVGFAREQWKNDEKAEAVETLDEAYEILKSQREIETRDSRARYALLTTIAAQFAGFGKTEQAIEIALENQNPDEQLSALSQIAQILTVHNEDDLARQALDMIADAAGRVFAVIAMADVKGKRGETDAAIGLLDEAATLTEDVQQFASRSRALNEIAIRFAGHGQAARARELALKSLDAIAAIRDESSQSDALAMLAAVYNSLGLEIADEEISLINSLLRRINL